MANIQIEFTMRNTNKMALPEIYDFEFYNPGGVKYVLLTVQIRDEETHEHIVEYELEVGEYYDDYKITKKEYNEKLTIQDTKKCDEYLIQRYEDCLFEYEYIEAINEDEFGLFI